VYLVALGELYLGVACHTKDELAELQLRRMGASGGDQPLYVGRMEREKE